ncbi:MAG: HAMP domain-containing histidine kinase [Chloroflexi bacterium]|nr:HAMP domain-containing histidine kinase [Chloroflexota bacterium]
MRSGVVQQAMEVSIRSCKKLLNLVDSMLDIARLEGGNVLLERRPTRLRGLVESVVADLQPLASEQDIELINDVSPDIPEIRMDDEKVSRVFINLIDNALKFSPAGGQVRVDARADGQRNVIECVVLDDGPGIPEDYRERVFDRFVQVQGRRGRRRGTGLGLAFVKLAVEAHHGAVWVENRPEGGSKFAFTLPAPGSPDDLALETQHPPVEKVNR